jgi:hypothetical protein
MAWLLFGVLNTNVAVRLPVAAGNRPEQQGVPLARPHFTIAMEGLP